MVYLSSSLVFIDATVDDASILLAGLKAGTEVIWLDAHQDGVLAITQVLATRRHLSSISRSQIHVDRGKKTAVTTGKCRSTA